MLALARMTLGHLTLNLQDACDPSVTCCFDLQHGQHIGLHMEDLRFVDMATLLELQQKITDVTDFAEQLNDISTQLSSALPDEISGDQAARS